MVLLIVEEIDVKEVEIMQRYLILIQIDHFDFDFDFDFELNLCQKYNQNDIFDLIMSIYKYIY